MPAHLHRKLPTVKYFVIEICVASSLTQCCFHHVTLNGQKLLVVCIGILASYHYTSSFLTYYSVSLQQQVTFKLSLTPFHYIFPYPNTFPTYFKTSFTSHSYETLHTLAQHASLHTAQHSTPLSQPLYHSHTCLAMSSHVYNIHHLSAYTSTPYSTFPFPFNM